MNENYQNSNAENNNSNDTDYTVIEIIDELMKDMSWEENPMYRMRALGFIKSEIFTAS